MEEKAAKLLLDVGVSIPIRTPGFLKKKGKPRHVVIRTPTIGVILLLFKEYKKIGVTYEELQGYTFEQNIEFYTTHAIAISRMVAYAIKGGFVFNRFIAWCLRWMVHPIFLQEAWFTMLSLLDTTAFHNIIESVEKVNLLKPRTSQE